MIVTVQHLRSFSGSSGRGICHAGARQIAVRLGLDWTQFVQHGLDEQVLMDTGDAMAIKLVEHAHSWKGNTDGFR